MQTNVLLRNVGVTNSYEIETYIRRGGYGALEAALTEYQPSEIVEIVLNSGLRGRGGAGFPAGRKWMFLLKDVYPRYLVCNADEGEPGTFKDRVLMEHDPHGLIEGIIISSYACEVEHALIYIRGEYDLSYQRLRRAVDQAYERGYLGKDILGQGYDLELSILRGAGAYICGEETSLLSSLEGKRGHPKLKPPFQRPKGSIASRRSLTTSRRCSNVPFIVANGADWYRQWGTERSPGLKLFCVSGHVERPGTYELALATPMRTLIYDVCGGPKDGVPLKAIISWRLVNTDDARGFGRLACNLDYESIFESGSMLGSGAVIAVNEQTCIVGLTERLTAFYKHESCGKCIPCREGTDWMYKILHRIEHGQGRGEDLDLLLDICDISRARAFVPWATLLWGQYRAASSDSARSTSFTSARSGAW